MTVSRPPHDIQPTYTEQYDLCFHWDISCSGLPHSNFYFHQFLFVLNVEKRHQNVCWHQENYTDIHSFHPCGAFESYVMPLCNRCEVNSELQNNWYKTNRPKTSQVCEMSAQAVSKMQHWKRKLHFSNFSPTVHSVSPVSFYTAVVSWWLN